ncbi:MAG TPA: GAF domain-containing sensor histidine kinase [Gemmatimonadaceae bacterium]|nr:GAF domain-containing sensor histidine kinase [Gemmatimonadaceae bacterium]
MQFSAIETESAAAVLQALITLGLAGLCAYLYRQFRKSYLAWWAVAWGLYVLRVGAILSFLTTDERGWLYWHQVTTGWTAIVLLGAALEFERPLRWRRRFLPLLLFPPIWSFIAIYRLDNFLLAAGPAVLFLSIATLWTGVVFLRHWRRTGSHGAALLGWGFVVWAIHHLDYPILRARGAWNPWGYYLDILFVLVTGAGIFLLVTEDLRRGLGALAALSGDLQGVEGDAEALDQLLARPLSLPGVRGTAILLSNADGMRDVFVRGAGSCSPLTGRAAEGGLRKLIDLAATTRRPQRGGDWPTSADGSTDAPYSAALPIFRGTELAGVLVILGDTRDPFTALDDRFLVALGQQVGAALENAELYRRLRARTAELERMALRMVHQHEEQRRTLSYHLHDETAQVFAAVKMQLGMVRESSDPSGAERLDRVLSLVDTGIQSIRNLTNDLRPSLLDDLGLLPALRALAADFASQSGLEVDVDAPPALPSLPDEVELALFRALQEALSNVARHAQATSVTVTLGNAAGGAVHMTVRDDGRAAISAGALEGHGRMGLAGMRERIMALGGTLSVRGTANGGVLLSVTLAAPENPA